MVGVAVKVAVDVVVLVGVDVAVAVVVLVGSPVLVGVPVIVNVLVTTTVTGAELVGLLLLEQAKCRAIMGAIAKTKNKVNPIRVFIHLLLLKFDLKNNLHSNYRHKNQVRNPPTMEPADSFI